MIPPEKASAQFDLSAELYASLSLSIVVNAAFACPPIVRPSARVDLTLSYPESVSL